jgi:hypothetical protein
MSRNGHATIGPARLMEPVVNVFQDLKQQPLMSKRLEERKERIRRPVSAGARIYGCRPCARPLLHCEVGMKIDLRGLHLFMTEP